ncbi:MAG: DNA repair protein RadC [Oscillospiraceae bacterium]|nr:DNA repair protein RadC [Oscillospiraceae bacterium]
MAVHKGHRARLRRQLLGSGLDSFSDVQVLELLLSYAIARKDVNPLAHILLERFGSLSAVLDAPVPELMKVDEVGECAAVLLSLTPQLLRRYSIDRIGANPILDTTEKAGNYLAPFFFGATEEQVYLLCLDAKCKVLDCRMLFIGSVNTVGVSVRRVVEAALHRGATSVILAHNHVSGIALPSKEDEDTTRALRAALETVGILLADHIVVADSDFVSMADSGFFCGR